MKAKESNLHGYFETVLEAFLRSIITSVPMSKYNQGGISNGHKSSRGIIRHQPQELLREG